MIEQFLTSTNAMIAGVVFWGLVLIVVAVIEIKDDWR